MSVQDDKSTATSRRLANLKRGGKKKGQVAKFTSFKKDLLDGYNKTGGVKHIKEAWANPRNRIEMLKIMSKLLPQEMLVKGDIKTTVQFVTKSEDSE